MTKFIVSACFGLIVGAAAIPSLASAQPAKASSPLAVQVAADAYKESLETSGQVRYRNFQRIARTQVQVGDIPGARKSLDEARKITAIDDPNFFLFNEAIKLSVEVGDGDKALAAIDALPADSKTGMFGGPRIQALATYGAAKAKDLDVAAVNSTVLRLEALLKTLPPDTPPTAVAPTQQFLTMNAMTRHGFDLALSRIAASLADSGDIALAETLSGKIANDNLLIRTLGSIGRRQNLDGDNAATATTIARIRTIMSNPSADQIPNPAEAIAAFAHCGDMEDALLEIQAVPDQRRSGEANAAARTVLADNNAVATIQIAHEYALDDTTLAKAAAMLYQQGHDAEAKQIEDSIKSLASKTDVEIAARHFQAAIDNLSRLPANDIATFQRVDKIIKAEIDAKDANAIANAATALAKLIPNSVFWQRQQPLQVAIDLDEAGYDKDAKAILAAAAENANVCAGAMRVAALKWIRSAYTEINDPQDAATFDSRIQAAELAYQTRPRPQAPAAVPSEADLERGKRIVKAIKELNAPNDGSDEQTAAALERASDALGDDRAMLGTVLFMAGMQRAGQERPLREKLHNFIEARQFKEAIDATSAFSGPAKINALIAVEHAQEKVGTFQDAYDTIKLMDDRQSRIDARLNLVAAITNTTHQ